MKNYKQILEAVNRGIKLALDDFNDDIPISQSISKVKAKDLTSKYLEIAPYIVDLGLPSGTLWAKYNLGTDWDKLNQDPNNTKWDDWIGNYYAWGELKPKSELEYNWENYKFANNLELIKYNKDFNAKPYIIDFTSLLLEDDAAYLTNNRFKIPSKEQFEELLKYTDKEFLEDYNNIKNVHGVLYRSKINGEKIFFPCSGYYYDNGLTACNCCFVQTSSFDISNIFRNYNLLTGQVDNEFLNTVTTINRHCGLPIRPVIRCY